MIMITSKATTTTNVIMRRMIGITKTTPNQCSNTNYTTVAIPVQQRLLQQQQQRRLTYFSTASMPVHDSSSSSSSNSDDHHPRRMTHPPPTHHHQPFPSLLLGANKSITALGTFAETQKIFLQPDKNSVQQMVHLLRTTRTGIVAHYYMDVELQGILQAVKQQLPHMIGIADSLKMGDMAVDMVASSSSSSTSSTKDKEEEREDACQQIICLGVDFMSESVAAILQRNGYTNVPVYRAAQAAIGCSLAESAETDTYRMWLQQEKHNSNNHHHRPLLHVVYINTSLETKAISNSIVPTITCTSSNVLQTILNAYIQIPNVQILYGPDTYMGENLITFLTILEQSWTNEQIQKDLHPDHTLESIRKLRDSIIVYPSGNCIVHHMFGTSVVNTVKTFYSNAYVTAHLEVPGEMFEIAMNKSLIDHGVCGSTSDILKFITRKVQEEAMAMSNITTTTTTTTTMSTTTNQLQLKQQQQQDNSKRLQFILGTEAGMVTSIVSSVQSILEETGNPNITIEIIFPVASEAVYATPEEENQQNTATNSMAVVPGVAGGDGCSTAGGCATCPFMKMNHFDAVIDLLEHIQTMQQQQQSSSKSTTTTNSSELILHKHLPPNRIQGKMIQGQLATELGIEPIVYMREFNRTKRLPDDLIQRVMR